MIKYQTPKKSRNSSLFCGTIFAIISIGRFLMNDSWWIPNAIVSVLSFLAAYKEHKKIDIN